MPIIIGFLGIALWMRIATIMEPVFGRKKWINLLADNTFSIMENQFLGFLLVKVAFGTIANGTKLFLKFDWSRCKSDIWWYYMPKDVEQTKNSVFISSDFCCLTDPVDPYTGEKNGKKHIFVRKTIVKRILL